ncbi:hypothetical protein [Mesorhizobium sp. ES1-6]|uniref:hypothetical protein n=1 Tax=Mesorhizobium sp. ES1-6 TaxID=2876626 RepID=UPI001CCB3D60|nr:hypothetical protein [Mesorhizobium sp. ES1-6]MBZ9804799.1 hypothetical protein [Mesorhizobium sp. ES1-6]
MSLSGAEIALPVAGSFTTTVRVPIREQPMAGSNGGPEPRGAAAPAVPAAADGRTGREADASRQSASRFAPAGEEAAGSEGKGQTGKAGLEALSTLRRGLSFCMG